jgi:hypothetical protein
MIQDPLLRTPLPSSQGPQVNAQPRVGNARQARVRVTDFSSLARLGESLAGAVAAKSTFDAQEATRQGQAFVADPENQERVATIFEPNGDPDSEDFFAKTPEERSQALSKLLREGGDYRAHPRFQAAVHREAGVYIARQFRADLDAVYKDLNWDKEGGGFLPDSRNLKATQALAKVREKYQDDPFFKDELAAQIMKPAMDAAAADFLQRAEDKRLGEMADFLEKEQVNNIGNAFMALAEHGINEGTEAMFVATVSALRDSNAPVWPSVSKGLETTIDILASTGREDVAIAFISEVVSMEFGIGDSSIADRQDIRLMLAKKQEDLRDKLLIRDRTDLETAKVRAEKLAMYGEDYARAAMNRALEEGDNPALAASAGYRLLQRDPEYLLLEDQPALQTRMLNAYNNYAQTELKRPETGDPRRYRELASFFQAGKFNPNEWQSVIASNPELSVQEAFDLEQIAKSLIPAHNLMKETPGAAMATQTVMSAIDSRVNSLPPEIRDSALLDADRFILQVQQALVTGAKNAQAFPNITQEERQSRYNDQAFLAAEKAVEQVSAYHAKREAEHEVFLTMLRDLEDQGKFEEAATVIQKYGKLDAQTRDARLRNLEVARLAKEREEDPSLLLNETRPAQTFLASMRRELSTADLPAPVAEAYTATASKVNRDIEKFVEDRAAALAADSALSQVEKRAKLAEEVNAFEEEQAPKIRQAKAQFSEKFQNLGRLRDQARSTGQYEGFIKALKDFEELNPDYRSQQLASIREEQEFEKSPAGEVFRSSDGVSALLSGASRALDLTDVPAGIRATIERFANAEFRAIEQEARAAATRIGQNPDLSKSEKKRLLDQHADLYSNQRIPQIEEFLAARKEEYGTNLLNFDAALEARDFSTAQEIARNAKMIEAPERVMMLDRARNKEADESEAGRLFVRNLATEESLARFRAEAALDDLDPSQRANVSSLVRGFVNEAEKFYRQRAREIAADTSIPRNERDAILEAEVLAYEAEKLPILVEAKAAGREEMQGFLESVDDLTKRADFDALENVLDGVDGISPEVVAGYREQARANRAEYQLLREKALRYAEPALRGWAQSTIEGLQSVLNEDAKIGEMSPGFDETVANLTQQFLNTYDSRAEFTDFFAAERENMEQSRRFVHEIMGVKEESRTISEAQQEADQIERGFSEAVTRTQESADEFLNREISGRKALVSAWKGTAMQNAQQWTSDKSALQLRAEQAALSAAPEDVVKLLGPLNIDYQVLSARSYSGRTGETIEFSDEQVSEMIQNYPMFRSRKSLENMITEYKRKAADGPLKDMLEELGLPDTEKGRQALVDFELAKHKHFFFSF